MEWRNIEGFEGYQVSSCGKIKRVALRIVKSNGTVVNYGERLMRPTKDSHGYYFVRIRKKGLWVHRAVAMAFIGLTEERKYVNHKDGNIENNDVSNLEICTSGENQKHAYDTGLRKIPLSKTNSNFRGTIIATNIKSGEKIEFNGRKELRDFGFPPASVYACCLGKQKQSKGYTFERVKVNERCFSRDNSKTYTCVLTTRSFI